MYRIPNVPAFSSVRCTDHGKRSCRKSDTRKYHRQSPFTPACAHQTCNLSITADPVQRVNGGFLHFLDYTMSRSRPQSSDQAKKSGHLCDVKQDSSRFVPFVDHNKDSRY